MANGNDYRDAGAGPSNVVNFPSVETLQPEVVPQDQIDAVTRRPPQPAGTGAGNTGKYLMWALLAVGLYFMFAEGGTFEFSRDDEEDW